MISRTKLWGFAFAVVIALSPMTARAVTYDINADFSTASNPNGVWTYGFTVGLGGLFTLYDQPGTNAWRHSVVQSFGAPADFNNPTGSTIGLLPAHTAAFHPGAGGEFSVYRFTTPNAGTYDLSAVFGAIDSGGTDVHILKNNVSFFDHAVDQSANSSVSFSSALALTAGDLIDFAVGFGANANFFNDSTSINASLSPSAVPEPSTYAMMLAGLSVLGLVVRRRKRNGPV